MESLDLQLKTFQQKLMLLIKQNQSLKKHNELLKQENQQQQQQLEEKETKLKLLENKVELIKLNAVSLDKADKKLLIKKIDTYLRDIEKCLAQLNA